MGEPITKEVKLSICRVCLQSGDNKFMSVFEQLGQYQVYEHIMSIAVVTILPADGMPDMVCPPCLLELQSAITFKNKCEESDRTLRSISLQADEPDRRISIDIKKEEFAYELGPEEYLDNLENFDSDMEVNPEPFVVSPAKGEKCAVQCNECLQFFRSRCKLSVHWKKEHKQSTFMCDICKRQFKSSFAFRKHKTTTSRSCSELKNADWVRVEGEGKKRIFHCTRCEYKSERFIHMRTHEVVHRPGEKPFKCKFCPSAYTQRGTLKQHVAEQHDASLRPTCHVCGKIINSRRRLYRHLQTHNEANIKCTVCDKLFKTKSSFKNHMKRHSGKKEYTCELCAAAFFTMAELCNHRRIQHVAQLYKCTHCEFQSRRQARIKRHESQHTTDGEAVPCVKCGRFYESLQRLQVHLVKYHKPKVFKCPECFRIYTSRKSVRYHLRKKHSLPHNQPLPQGTESSVPVEEDGKLSPRSDKS